MTRPWGALLPRAFFARDGRLVAPELVGVVLVRRHDDGVVALRITECEAYLGPEDTGSHTRFGRTARNAPMWGEAGRAYVYLCYGVHWMLNLVSGRVDEGQAVLIRGAEVVAGHDVVARRRSRDDHGLLAGPGKVGAALAVTDAFSGHDCTKRGALEAHAPTTKARVLAGPRIGIDYATPADRARPWRFADADARAVTHKRWLKPI